MGILEKDYEAKRRVNFSRPKNLGNSSISKFALPEDIFDFQEFEKLDFEKAWEHSHLDFPLSDEEKTLFPENDATITNMDSVLMNFETRNPMMTSIAVDESPIILSQTEGDLIDVVGDSMTGPINVDFNEILDMPLDFAPEDSALPDPTTVITKSEADDVMEIHSYSQPAPVTPQKVKVAVPSVKITKKKTVKTEAGKELIQINFDRVEQPRLRKPKRRFDESSDDSEVENYVPNNKKSKLVKKTTQSKKQ